MSIMKIKNSNYNNLVSFLKESKMRFTTNKMVDNVETIEFFPMLETRKSQLMALLTGYGNRLYHDTTLGVDFSVRSEFNYLSNQYENMTENNSEEELPLYYIENTNDQNSRLESLKAINTKIINKSYIKTILNSQRSLNLKTQNDLMRMKNVYFGKDFEKGRAKKFLNEFPYYNRLEINSLDNNDFLGKILNKLDFYEEMLEDFINPKSILTTQLLINGIETSIDTYSITDTIIQSPAKVNDTNKVILSKSVKEINYISNNFKKYLMVNYLNDKDRKFLKNFKQIYENELCEKEYVLYKIEKYRKQETTPIQNFWMHDESFKEFYDYQIKLNSSYRYSVKAYSIIYGTSTSVSNIRETRSGSIKADITSSPSYRMAIVDFGEITIKNIPSPPMPPSPMFLNESNSENYLKIYLNLKNSSKSEEFINITEEDATLIQDIETNQEGKINFQYITEDGKFEVYRITEKPKSYNNFENEKILDVRNKYSSTGVMFKDKILPNKKYYYMFRAINLVGTPSNPTPVYEVELIKDASKSKVVFNTISFDKQEANKDKTFKSLIQITPSFQQQIFNDQSEEVLSLNSFDKKINNLTLGTAVDKVWGKKFKIRVKSKDTGKIIDLNVKFNLIKDNIK